MRYEERIQELEQKLEETSQQLLAESNAESQLQMQELTIAYERSQVEVTHLKSELSRTKRELEIAGKSVVATKNSGNKCDDANSLSLAIKSFKRELAEKEKEILRVRKEVGDLKKTNLQLKREREKYLKGPKSHAVGFKGENVKKGVNCQSYVKKMGSEPEEDEDIAFLTNSKWEIV